MKRIFNGTNPISITLPDGLRLRLRGEGGVPGGIQSLALSAQDLRALYDPTIDKIVAQAMALLNTHDSGAPGPSTSRAATSSCTQICNNVSSRMSAMHVVSCGTVGPCARTAHCALCWAHLIGAVQCLSHSPVPSEQGAAMQCSSSPPPPPPCIRPSIELWCTALRIAAPAACALRPACPLPPPSSPLSPAPMQVLLAGGFNASPYAGAAGRRAGRAGQAGGDAGCARGRGGCG